MGGLGGEGGGRGVVDGVFGEEARELGRRVLRKGGHFKRCVSTDRTQKTKIRSC